MTERKSDCIQDVSVSTNPHPNCTFLSTANLHTVQKSQSWFPSLNFLTRNHSSIRWSYWVLSKVVKITRKAVHSVSMSWRDRTRIRLNFLKSRPIKLMRSNNSNSRICLWRLPSHQVKFTKPWTQRLNSRRQHNPRWRTLRNWQVPRRGS